jgi:hypothetical protein
VVISINDPSTANYVATVVPGTETNLNAGSVLANVTTADRLGASAIAAGAAPGQTAVVTWMNYDAPQSIGQAVANQLTGNGSTAAIQAAPAFAQFQNGLAALNPNATTTVIGDSYGSLVVGQAALVPGGFPATNVVAVASPGMDVQDASAFGGSQVFAARDTNDPIYWADMTGLHGTDPVSPSFHATVFDAGDGPTDWGLAHTYYFSPGSPGMVNMGLIIAGQGQNVTLQPR